MVQDLEEHNRAVHEVAIELFPESEWPSPFGLVSKDVEETASKVNDDNSEGDESVQDAVMIVVRKKVIDVSSRTGREGKVEGEGLCV